MDKLENETWEEYAFRNNLFIIKYSDKEKTLINDITMPIHTNVKQRHTYPNDYHNTVNGGNIFYEIGFIDFIMHELYNLRDKYKTGCYGSPINKVEVMTNEREKDIHRQNWLFKQLDYWETIGNKRQSEKIQQKKKWVELYQKYLKNKDIQTQIKELEQKINKLKSEII